MSAIELDGLPREVLDALPLHDASIDELRDAGAVIELVIDLGEPPSGTPAEGHMVGRGVLRFSGVTSRQSDPPWSPGWREPEVGAEILNAHVLDPGDHRVKLGITVCRYATRETAFVTLTLTAARAQWLTEPGATGRPVG